MERITFRKFFGHLHTTMRHRRWVRHYCFLAGIPWRGLMHDLSKYNPVEFLESARYWVGTSSPINEAKANQFDHCSLAWQHHKGRNKHHWEYWTDEYSKGTVCHIMPKKYFIEMICDFLGAGRAYMGKANFYYTKENSWWVKAQETTHKGMPKIHQNMVSEILNSLCIGEDPWSIGYHSSDMICSPEQMIKNGLIENVYDRYMAEMAKEIEDESNNRV